MNVSRSNIEVMRLKLAIFDYLQAAILATFPQLMDAMHRLVFEVYGKTAICYKRNANVNYWQGASPNLATAITELESEGEIHMEIISPIIYYVDRTILEIPPATTRQINYLTENWGDAAWITKPVWVPVALMPRGMEMVDLIQKPITPKTLKLALNNSDIEHIWQDEFEALVSSEACEPRPIDGAGRGGK